jgi:HK97 family phage prohead protease
MSALVSPENVHDRPPRDGLIRLWAPDLGNEIPGIKFRDADASGTNAPTLFGHFAVFNRWTEIDSFFEGTFMERIAPGAFKKTFREQRDQIRVLFQHGRDAQLGMKPLGTIRSLSEDGEGASYEVPLFRGIPELIMDGLRDDQYGASFKFRVMKEDLVKEPRASEDNPKGLDERTIREVQLFEFGPVTFGAYPEATAGLRSLTDDYFLDGLAHADPELVRMAASGVDLAGLIAHRMGGRPVRFSAGGKEEVAVEGTSDSEEVVRTAGKAGAPECPATLPHGVLDADGALVACHATPEQARSHAETLGTVTRAATEETSAETAETETQDEGRDDVVGAVDTKTEPEIKETAQPETSSTPLIGPSGQRESWRI